MIFLTPPSMKLSKNTKFMFHYSYIQIQEILVRLNAILQDILFSFCSITELKDQTKVISISGFPYKTDFFYILFHLFITLSQSHFCQGVVNFWFLWAFHIHDGLCSVASVLSDSVMLWTIACQAPLSMGFSWQEYWSRLPCPPPEDHPDPGIEPMSLMYPVLAGKFFTSSAIWV